MKLRKCHSGNDQIDIVRNLSANISEAAASAMAQELRAMVGSHPWLDADAARAFAQQSNAASDSVRESTDILIAKFQSLESLIAAQTSQLSTSLAQVQASLALVLDNEPVYAKAAELVAEPEAQQKHLCPAPELVRDVEPGKAQLEMQASTPSTPDLILKDPMVEEELDSNPCTLDNILDNIPVLRQVHSLREAAKQMSQEPPRSGLMYEVASSPRFEALCMSVILFNAIFAAIEADVEMRLVPKTLSSQPSQEMAIFIIESLMLVFYLVELVIKLAAHRLFFFFNSHAKWNIFDFTVVVLCLCDKVVTLLTMEGMLDMNLSFIRFARFLKVTKVLRLVRALRFLRELRLMLMSVTATFVSLLWALVFLACFMFVFSLIIQQGVAQGLIEAHDKGRASEEEIKETQRKFRSVLATMFQIYGASSTYLDWEDTYQEIGQAGEEYKIVFVLFTLIMSLAVMNILTGMIVESVANVGRQDEDTQRLNYRQKHNEAIAEIKALFKEVDRDTDGCISLDEFRRTCSDSSERVMYLMDTLSLSMKDADHFMRVMLSHGVAVVDIELFVQGLLQLRGPASSMDIQCLRIQCAKIQAMVQELARQEHFTSL